MNGIKKNPFKMIKVAKLNSAVDFILKSKES